VEQHAQSIRILIIEDVEADAELSLLKLKRAGLHFAAHRVESQPELRRALCEFSPNIILSDFSLPQFDGLLALELARELAPDTPFIFISGTMGEERAVTALHSGAVDYLLKGNLARLPAAVIRALNEAQVRQERRAEQARMARLDRVLRMLSGINALMVRVRDRTELLNETCRLAVATGGYATALVYLKSPGVTGLQALAESGTSRTVTESLRDAILQLSDSDASILQHVATAGREFVCNDTTALKDQGLTAVLQETGLRSLVALPIRLENASIGALVLTGSDAGTVSEEELQMLREVSGNLSFALQYLHKDTTVRLLSHFDPQTGLARRSLFCERLAKLISEPASRSSRHVVAIIDIARLSLINDSFSRRIGDLLLDQVADRFKRHFPQIEHLAHFGGGTFAMVVTVGTRSVEEATAAAREHAVALFGAPFVIEEREIPVTIKSGLAIFPDHAQDAAALVQNAEAALRNARTSGERQIQYSERHQAQILSRLALEHKLRLALKREQFDVHYQPKVNVVSRRIEGVEALIRWHDPESGLVSPAAFLPVLESTGLILDVGDWTVRRAALDCQHWLRAGIAPVRIAVNISPAQLRQPDFVETFLSALAGWSTPFAGLDIEITEGTLHEELDPELDKLKMLRNAGVRIAIDDFGTGYSSLSRLAKLPIDTLKIDRSFVCQVPQDYAGKMLVKTIITLARAFRLTTVAEGVEAQDQLDFLSQAGCDQSQGYLHSHPLPSNQFITLLEQGRGQLIRPPEAPGSAGAAGST
jgi:diguanylate cyclase (GGDEF)-like protein